MQARLPWLKLTRPMYVALALTPMVVLTQWSVGEACSCPPEPTAAESLKIADAVFEGTIVDQRAYVSFERNCTGPAIEYDVIVRRAWKGVFDRRVSLQRASVCSPAFRVGETALIYAGRHNDEIFVLGCLPTKRIDWAAADVAQLGVPIATFPGHAVPVATSLPISRWLRAHVAGGIGVYAYTFAEREIESPTWDMIALSSAAVLQALAACVFLVRKRWRTGVRLLAGSALSVTATIFWTGHVFLSSSWSEPFLMW